MGWSEPYLTRPISIGDLATALGTTSSDLGDVIKNYGGMANKWAVHKAVKSSAVGILSRADKKALNFGLTAPSAQSSFAATFGQAWVYSWPTAGQPNEWFRILDYDGYNKYAEPPIQAIGDIQVYQSSGDFDFGDYVQQNVSGGDDGIAWDDLPAINTYYLCAVFAKNANFTGDYLAKTASSTLANGGTSLVITESDITTLLNNGYTHYYLVGRSATLSGLVSPTSNSANYKALPCPNNSSDVMGKFTINAAPVASVVIARVSNVQSPSRSTDFFNASNYIGPESVTPVDTDYFYSPSPYYLHFGLDITAGTSAFDFGSTAKVRLSETFNSGSGYSSPVNCTILDENFNSVSQVSVPAGQTKRVYLIASVPILSLYSNGSQGGTVTEHKRFATRVEIYQNSTLVDRTNDIRVRNYQ